MRLPALVELYCLTVQEKETTGVLSRGSKLRLSGKAGMDTPESKC